MIVIILTSSLVVMIPYIEFHIMISTNYDSTYITICDYDDSTHIIYMIPHISRVRHISPPQYQVRNQGLAMIYVYVPRS